MRAPEEIEAVVVLTNQADQVYDRPPFFRRIGLGPLDRGWLDLLQAGLARH
jgi:Ser-tRNA(Ala) deacylase AlaX